VNGETRGKYGEIFAQSDQYVKMDIIRGMLQL